MSLNPSKKDNSNSEIILELFELISKTSWYKSDRYRFNILLQKAGSKFDINTKDSEGNTLLNKAAKMNNVIATQSLVKIPHIDVNNFNNDGENPLITASYNGYYRLFNVLSSLVGKIDLNAKDKQGYPPLIIAAKLGHEEIINILSSKVGLIDLNLEDSYGYTAINYAAENGYANIVKILANCQGIDLNKVNKKGYSPLHSAVLAKNNEIIEILSKFTKLIDLNVLDKQGNSPLALAVKYPDNTLKYKQVIKALINSTAVDLNIKNNHGETPLIIAVKAHNKLALKLLASTQFIDYTIYDNSEKTAIEHAKNLGEDEIKHFLNFAALDYLYKPYEICPDLTIDWNHLNSCHATNLWKSFDI